MAGVPLQPINSNPATGTVDANGNLTLKFGNVPPMQVWSAMVAVPDATPDIRWLASISEVPATTFYGSSPAGPFSLPPQSQLKITASNLTPGDTYTAVISGSAIEQDLADPSPALAPPATNAVSVINEEVFVAGPINDTTGAGVTFTQNVPPAWSVLHFFNTIAQPAQVTVTGVQTGILYANKLNVEGGPGSSSPMTPVLIDPAADQQVTIFVQSVGTIFHSSVWVTAQLNSSVFAVNNANQPLYLTPGNPAGPGPANLGFGYNFDVVPYGGARKVAVSRSSAGTSSALAAPVPGTAYRLHRIAWSFLAGTTAVELLGHTSGFLYTVYQTAVTFHDPENLDGQLVTEGLDVLTVGGGANAYLTYDIVANPVIG